MLLLDQHVEHPAALHQCKGGGIGLIHADPGHIAQLQDLAGPQAGEWNFADILQRLDPALDLQRVAVPAVTQLAGGGEEVGLLHQAAHLSEGYAVAVQRLGVVAYMHLRLHLSHQHRLGDAVGLLEATGQHLLGPAFERQPGLKIRFGVLNLGDPQYRHRLVGGGLVDQLRAPRLLRQHIAHLVELLADVQEGQVHVHSPAEPQRDQALPLAGKPVHLLHPLHRAQQCLHRLVNPLLHLAGGRPAPVGPHQQRRGGHLRQQVHREVAQGHCPEDQGGEDQHDGRYGSFEQHAAGLVYGLWDAWLTG